MFSLYQAFQSIKNENDFNDFMIDLCTPKEIRDLNDRFKIAQLLFEKKISQREIAKKLNCSITTVTRVSRFLFQENYKGYQKVINKLKKKNV